MPLNFFFDARVLLLDLLVLILIVADLLQEQVFVVLLTHILDSEPLLVALEPPVLIIQPLRHISHHFQLTIEGLFFLLGVLITLLLLHVIVLKLLPVSCEVGIQTAQ